MTYEVQQTRWDRLIRRVSGSIGPGSRVSETISELFPVLDVERVPSELLVLAGTRLAWGRSISPAVAGENARAQLFNPAGSGQIITITHLVLHPGGSDVVEMGILQVGLTDLSAVARYRDSRFGVALEPVAELRTDSNVGATPATFRVRAISVESFQIQDSNDICVLSPGFGLTLSETTVNSSLNVSYMWRERTAEESELNL